MIDPSKFTLNSNFRYHKLIASGSMDTTGITNASRITLEQNIPQGSTWVIGIRINNDLRAGEYGALMANGDLVWQIQRQAPITLERIHWRVYGR